MLVFLAYRWISEGQGNSNRNKISHNLHRDLKSDSHKRFGNRDFACWAYILDYGESKKGCLNYFRNRSAHTFWGTFIKYKSLLTAKFLSNGRIL